MKDLYIYGFQSGFMMILLYGLYWFFLSKDTFHKQNRYYLMGTLILSVIIPFIKYPMNGTTEISAVQMLEPIIVTPGNRVAGLQNNLVSQENILMLYLSGVALFFSRFVYQLIRLLILVRKYGIHRYNGLKLVLIDNNHSPFSVFNLIVINRNLLHTSEFEKIIAHEKTHVDQWHTLDLMVMECIQIFQWYNPFLWLYRRAIKQTHEYLADDKVLSMGHKSTDYQQLLLNQTFGTQFILLSNNFNHSLIKKRFIMMTKKRTEKSNLLKWMFIMPALVLFSFVFSLSFSGTTRAQADSKEAVGQSLAATESEPAVMATQQEEPAFTVVEEMPEYPGGKEAMYKFLVNNIKYPEESRKNGTQGTVFTTFIVEKSGKISNIRVLKSVNEELDKEAVRVISEMPKWNPGKEKGKPVRVVFNLPISYKLDEGAGKDEEKKSTKKPYYDVKKK